VFQELLARISRELAAARIPYMVIGGQAVLLYGEPRLTKDIDITLGVGTDRYESIRALSHRLNLKFLTEDPEAFVIKTMVLPLLDEQTGIRIDLIFSFSSYEQQAIARSKSVTFDVTAGVSVQFASLEDIIIHKMIAGRPRDIEDIKSIILKNPAYDKTYISRWLSEFDKGLDTKYLDAFETLATELEQ